MTPAQLDRRQMAWLKSQEHAERDMIRLAHTTASLIKSKRIPSLQTLLTPPRRLSPEEQQARQAEFEQLAREMS